MALEVIGAGFGRTGTKSLHAALQTLGFAPCYHMAEVFPRGPERFRLWEQAANGDPDWNAIFGEYKATVDFPACTFWRQLAEHYPNAKVLLSVRDPESWFNSTQETIFSPRWIDFLKTSIAGDFIQGTINNYFDQRMHDKEHLIQRFHEHVAEVQATIPAERLLTYEVKQGWEPLCEFLEVPIPGEAFPRINDSAETKVLLDHLIKNGFEAVLDY